MPLRKIKGIWYVDFRHEGVRYRKKSPGNLKKIAKKYLLSLQERLAENESLIPNFVNTTIIKGLLEKSLTSLGDDFHPSCEVFAWRFYSELVAASIAGDKTISKVAPVKDVSLDGTITCGFCKKQVERLANSQKYCLKKQDPVCHRQNATAMGKKAYALLQLKKGKNAVQKP